MSEPSAHVHGHVRPRTARSCVCDEKHMHAYACASELLYASIRRCTVRARKVNPARADRIPWYSRTALYGFPTANRGHLLVWRREMRSEGVANRPDGQRFWDQKTSLCLLHLPTVLQRPFLNLDPRPTGSASLSRAFRSIFP